MKPDAPNPDPDPERDKEKAPPLPVPEPDEPEAIGVDARDDPEKLKENRDHLGVDDEHKTPDMQKHHRGTFP